MIEADIQIAAESWRSPDFDSMAVARRAVDAVGELAEVARGNFEISLALTDDARMRVLNRDHRGKDRATNVLAFPPAPGPLPPGTPPVFLGDVVLAFESVKREAESQNKPFTNHMIHLIVHGSLHLLGYDHENERDAARMEAEEAAILGRLGIPDPYRTNAAKEAGTAPRWLK